MIFNLSQPQGRSVNDNIQKSETTVAYCSVMDVIREILHSPRADWYLAKIDLTDAYRLVPIKKSDWKFLGMRIGDEFFIDRCLPMGASSSCRIFQRISDAIAWMFKASCPVVVRVFNYLDDFLLLVKGKTDCEMALTHVEHVCRRAGIPISPHKTIRPSTVIVFLGLGIDAGKNVLFIPPEKVHGTLKTLKEFLKLTRPQVKEWQSVLGKLSHLTQVVPAGRAHLSSVYGSLHGILSQQGYQRRRIGKEAREDLGVWVSFLEDLPPTRQFKMFDSEQASFSIYSDASTSVGFGCIFGTSWFAGVWPDKRWKKLNIAVLELFPIYAALYTWRSGVRDTAVNVYTDNKALVPVLGKLYARDKMLRLVLKPLALLCLEENVRILPSHIRGVANVGADLLSCGKIAEFLERFPVMDREPTAIPQTCRPENREFF